MNIKFDGLTYEELFYKLFNSIAKKYDLTIEIESENRMVLKQSKFILSFAYDIDTIWIYYTNLNNNKSYLLSNYINVNAEDIDRNDVPKNDIIYKNLERTLTIQSRVLARKFTNLLEGKQAWFDEYKASAFYIEMNK